MSGNINILAISGSLRADSSNNAVIRCAEKLVPAGVDFTVYNKLGEIPPFNDSKDAPDPVINFRQAIANADGVFICQPEYAFGVSGVLKNAVDWTVGSGELVYKPLALITAATGGENAHAAFLLTLKALSSNISEDSKMIISYVRSKMKDGEISDITVKNGIKDVVNSLLLTIKASKEKPVEE